MKEVLVTKIDKQNIKSVMITCNTCGETYEVTTTSFKDAGLEAKQSGWICLKIDDEFVDFCRQDCADKYKEIYANN